MPYISEKRREFSCLVCSNVYENEGEALEHVKDYHSDELSQMFLRAMILTRPYSLFFDWVSSRRCECGEM